MSIIYVFNFRTLKNVSYLQLHKCALAYASAHLINKELEEFKEYWNSHRIRENRSVSLPSGIPNDLFEMPSVDGMLK